MPPVSHLAWATAWVSVRNDRLHLSRSSDVYDLTDEHLGEWGEPPNVEAATCRRTFQTGSEGGISERSGFSNSASHTRSPIAGWVAQLASLPSLCWRPSWYIGAWWFSFRSTDCLRSFRVFWIRSHSPVWETGKRRISWRIHSTNRRTRIPECPFRVRGGSEGFECMPRRSISETQLFLPKNSLVSRWQFRYAIHIFAIRGGSCRSVGGAERDDLIAFGPRAGTIFHQWATHWRTPRAWGSGYYWFLGLVVGDCGARVILKVCIRIFQSSPSRVSIPDQ